MMCDQDSCSPNHRQQTSQMWSVPQNRRCGNVIGAEAEAVVSPSEAQTTRILFLVKDDFF